MIRFAFAACAAIALAGCSTSQEVKMTQLNAPRSMATAALVPEAGNSPEMDAAMRSALMAQGVTPKPSLPAGTQKSRDASLIVTYVDTWHWDITMYLRLLTVSIYDAETGSMVAIGNWKNSPAHSWPDYNAVVTGLVGEMVTKLKGLPKGDMPADASAAPPGMAASAAAASM